MTGPKPTIANTKTKRRTPQAAQKPRPATQREVLHAKDSAPKRRGKRVARPTSARRYHPGPAIVSEEALAAALAALAEKDPALIRHLVEVGGPPPLRAREPGFMGLAWIVVSQQVSVASANAIHGRLAARVAPFEADVFLACPQDDLKACGLSSPKLRSLTAIAEAVSGGRLDFAALADMDAEAAHAALTAIHGVGPWTADIFLLFCLGHPDAWPAGDLALQEAARLALGRRSRPDAKALERIGERWRPYRGVAARLLWSFYKVARGRDGMALAAK